MHVNLNLITALDALLEEGSVTGAAQRLSLSQPAMSRTLGRIRALTNDQILVRTGRSMTPTPYAVSVRERVRQLVRDGGGVLSPHVGLDLATLERTFTIRSHDALTLSMAPALVNLTRRQAPMAVLRFISEGPSDTDDLRHGRVDLDLSAGEPRRPEIDHEVLGEARLVVAMRSGHPLSSGRLTVKRYVDADHVVITRRGRLHDRTDDALEAAGHRRNVIATVPSTAAALLLVRAGDTITTVAQDATQPLLRALNLATKPVPLKLPPLTAISSWHQRNTDDPAHRWLRGLVRQVLTELVFPQGAPH